MDDDKQDKAGVLPGGDAIKRKPPTIDLAASEVTDNPRQSDAPGPSTESLASESVAPDTVASASSSSDASASESGASSSRVSRSPSLVLSAVMGAVTAVLVLGAAKFSGLLDTPPPAPPPVTNTASKSDVETLGTRIAKIESDAAKPVPASRPVADPIIAARLETLEKSLASLRGDITAARAQSEKVTAAISEIKSAAPQAAVSGAEPPAAPVVDTSAIEERLAKIERATAALSAAAAAPPPAPQAPAEDPRVRRVAAATLLDSAVRQGEPYTPALAAVRSLGDDADVLKPLDAFATSGIPTANALSRELLALLPKIAPKIEAPAAPSGMVERLQQSAAKLVRVERTDAAGNGTSAILARVTAAAQRSDLVEARRELMLLTAQDRAPVQAWIAKIDARDAALAASRQFAAETMTALSKPAR